MGKIAGNRHNILSMAPWIGTGAPQNRKNTVVVLKQLLHQGSPNKSPCPRHNCLFPSSRFICLKPPAPFRTYTFVAAPRSGVDANPEGIVKYIGVCSSHHPVPSFFLRRCRAGVPDEVSTPPAPKATAVLCPPPTGWESQVAGFFGGDWGQDVDPKDELDLINTAEVLISLSIKEGSLWSRAANGSLQVVASVGQSGSRHTCDRTQGSSYWRSNQEYPDRANASSPVS